MLLFYVDYFQEKHGTYIKQLMPSTVHLKRIKLKVFGNSAVGKTTLIHSLKCGYFGSLLRKAGIGTSGSVNNNTTNKAVKGLYLLF